MTERTEVRLRCKADGGLLAVLTGTDQPDTLRWCNDPRAAQGRAEYTDDVFDFDEWLDKHPGLLIGRIDLLKSGWTEAPIDAARDHGTDQWALCPTKGCGSVIEMWHVIDTLEHAWRQGRSSVKA